MIIMSIFNTIIFVAYFCVLCLGRDLPEQTQHAVKPGYVYYPQINGYLKLHTEPADWLTARVNCHEEDAFLTSPWTANFTSAVHQLLSNVEQSSEETSNEEQWLSLVFSGALEKYPEGMYRDYLERLPGVMIDLERCGVFYANGTTGHVNCKLMLPFVCYAVATAPPPSSTSKYTTPKYTTPKSTPAPVPSCIGLGYELSKQTMSCYKFNVNGQTWTNANTTCTTEGASLVVINSDEEARTIAGLFQQYPATSINNVSNDYDTNFAHVGIFYDSGVWKTINYQTLEQAGYAKWMDATTHVIYHDSYPYGGIHRDGNFWPVNDGYLAFICEKAPVFNTPNIL